MISYFVKHPNAANLMMLAAVVLGLFALPTMERETYPEFSASRVTVNVTYPGTSAADVDAEICQELDAALTGVTHLDDFECVSVDSLATATLSMSDAGDIQQFYADIASIAMGIELPDDADLPAVSIAGQTEVIALLAISGIDNPGGLIRYANELSTRLSGLSMVSQATVSSVSDSQIQVVFDQKALRLYGVSPRNVADAVAANSLTTPLGNIDTQTKGFMVRYSDARRDVSALEDMIILQNQSGGFVRLGDLAVVRWAEETPEVRATIDGRPAAILRIEKNKADDAIRAFEQVNALILSEEAKLPDPFKIDVINNSTENIRERIDLIVTNTMQGLVLVIGIMWLFFRFREAIWISMTLPISFLAGFFVLAAIGVTINMISLLALLMAVGLIMDDSIVIADNIAKWRGRVGPKEAAIRGVSEVLPGVISSFLTTACVFAPLMYLSGEMGAILQVIPIVLLITLAISLVEAFLVLPNHLSHGTKETKERRAVRMLDGLSEGTVLPVVRFLVAWRYLTLGTVVAALVLCAGLMFSGLVKFIGFPVTEGDTVTMRLALNAGTRVEQTEAVVDRAVEALEEINVELTPLTEGGAPLVTRVLVQYAQNSDVKDNGSHTATITVDLLESTLRNIAAADFLDLWRKELEGEPGIAQISFAQAALGPGGTDIDVTVSAASLQQAEKAGAELLRRLQSRPDVSEVALDFRGGRPEVALTLNSYGYAIGLTPQALSDQLRAAFSGLESDSFREGRNRYSVQVELGDTIPTLSALERFPIALAGDRQTPLSAVADIRLMPTYPQITRQNGAVIARITGQIDKEATTSTEISAFIMNTAAPEIQRQYPDASFSIGGAAEDQAETQNSIFSALIVGMIAIYIVLAFQFRSYTLPLVAMLSIPFAAIGTILGHVTFGIDMSMPSLIGFASLAGIVVNNAILFVTFFQVELRDGDYVNAAVEAARQRFRPIVLSSATTFFGLTPILFETSPQAQVLIPLVVAVAFGLLASTVLVIFVLPSALAAYFDHFSVKAWQDQQAVDAVKAV